MLIPSDSDVQGYGYEEDRDPRDGLLSPGAPGVAWTRKLDHDMMPDFVVLHGLS